MILSSSCSFQNIPKEKKKMFFFPKMSSDLTPTESAAPGVTEERDITVKRERDDEDDSTNSNAKDVRGAIGMLPYLSSQG
jgi:hypothetical protein